MRAVLSRRGVPAGYRNHWSGNDGSDARAGTGSLSLHRPVDSRAGDAEQVGELSGAVLASMKQSHHVCFLPMVQLWLLTTQTPFGFGDLHALSGAKTNQVRLELGDHREHVEQQPADRIGRVVHRSTQVETNLPDCELVGDGSGVWQRPGKPVELGDHQGVAFTASGQGFTQTWPLPVCAGQPVVHVHPVYVHALRGEAVALGCQVLLIGGASGEPDE